MSKISSRTPAIPPSTTVTTPPAISPTPIPPQPPPPPPSPPSGDTTRKRRQTLKIDRPVSTFNGRGEVKTPGRRGAHVDVRLMPLYDSIDDGYDDGDYEEGEEGEEPFIYRRRRRRHIEPPFYILHRLVTSGAIGQNKTPT